MYTKEQEAIALKAYEQLGSVHAVPAEKRRLSAVTVSFPL